MGFDTVGTGCRLQVLGRDTVVDTLYAYVAAERRDETQAERSFRREQANIVLSVFPSFAPLDLRDVPPTAGLPIGSEHLHDADAILWFQVNDEGRLTGMKLERRSGWNALDLALQRAVRRADSLRLLRPLPSAMRGQAVDLWLGVGTERMAGPQRVLGLVRYDRPRLGGVPGEFGVITRGRGRYPDEAARIGVTDTVMMEFTIDTNGYVVPGTIQPLRATFREFVDEATQIVRTTRFRPFTIDGCAIRIRFRVPIPFTMRP